MLNSMNVSHYLEPDYIPEDYVPEYINPDTIPEVTQRKQQRRARKLKGDIQKVKDEKDKQILVVQAKSAGYHAGDFATITLNEVVVPVRHNEQNNHRGFHVVIINPMTGLVI